MFGTLSRTHVIAVPSSETTVVVSAGISISDDAVGAVGPGAGPLQPIAPTSATWHNNVLRFICFSLKKTLTSEIIGHAGSKSIAQLRSFSKLGHVGHQFPGRHSRFAKFFRVSEILG